MDVKIDCTGEPKELYHLRPGTALNGGHYVVGRSIGSGGFGIIYEAWDTHLSTVVAIKEYYPSGMVNRVPGETDVIVYRGAREEAFQSGLEHFLLEARSMAKFKDCPYITSVYDYFEENHTAYFTMEYMQGMTFSKYLEMCGGKADEKTAVEIALAVAEALKVIHKEHVVHRDISPDNIFLCQGKTKVKLFDFGAAMFSSQEEKTMTWQILKPGYTPPEQYATKAKIGPWTDIYALGATIYRAVTGTVPAESTNRVFEHVKKNRGKREKWEDPLIRPRNLEPSVSKELERTILMAMAIQPELRFPNINQLILALQYQRDVEEVDVFLKKRKWRRAGLVAGIVLAAGGLCAAALGILRSRQSEARILQEAAIEAWIPYQAEEDPEEKRNTYEAMSREYLEQYKESGVTVEFTCIPSETYEEELKQAFQEGTGPELYESTGLSGEVMEQADSLRSIGGWSEIQECDPLKNGAYEKWYSSQNRLPLGMELPVLCANMRLIGDGNLPDSIEKAADLEQGAQNLAVMTETDQLENFLNTYYDGAGITADGDWAFAEPALEDYENYLKENGVSITQDDGLQRFQNGELAYLVTDVHGYRVIQSAQKNFLVKPLALSSDHLIGRFTDEWSVNKRAGSAEKEAAKVLLSYWLSEGAQVNLHAVYGSAVPVNDKQRKKLLEDVYSDLTEISKQSENLTYAGEKQETADAVRIQKLTAGGGEQ